MSPTTLQKKQYAIFVKKKNPVQNNKKSGGDQRKFAFKVIWGTV